MKLLIEEGKTLQKLEGKAILLDNDYLSIIYREEEILEQTLKFGALFVDLFTQFEFLRDVFDNSRLNKTLFIQQNKVFNVLPEQNEALKTVRETALELSRIYSSQGKAKGVSLVDLLLGAQLIKYHNSMVLVTGNRKDFPSIIFDLVCVLNFEQENDSVRAISVLKANMGNYHKYKEKVDSMLSKELANIREEIKKEIKT